jgi:hypothetical protein
MLTFARVRATAIVSLLVAAAVVTVSMALDRDSSQARVIQSCPEGFVPVELSLPAVSSVKINVYNGTDPPGLAAQVGDNFANRDFQVLEFDDHDSEVDAVAELHYGPPRWAPPTGRAYFLNEATTVFDIDRDDDVVDVVLGTQFRQLASPTEVPRRSRRRQPGACRRAPASD